MCLIVICTDMCPCEQRANGADAQAFPEYRPMRDWRQVIEQWVAQERSIASLAQHHEEFWRAMWAGALHPPSPDRWPDQLPTCQALLDFYRRCDGGSLAWFEWFPVSHLVEQNRYWVELLRDYYWDGRGDVLVPRRHVVLALDAGGCPVVWDATSDVVRAFQWDGGDWESPLASSIEAFLTTLVNPVESANEADQSWCLFLNWLDHQAPPYPPA
jgi:hypothetical protein